MQSNGAVICFQKYTLGGECGNSTNGLDSPVCLGYFGRVDVQKVQNFKEYVRIASRHGADQACSRKQLLLYRIDNKLDWEINIASDEQRQQGGLPFCSVSGEQASICCCTALNISTDVMSKSNGLGEIANQLFSELQALQKEKKFYFAITGLLGTEDLCVILLADKYNVISEAISTVQKLKCPSSDCYVIDNSHSILMLDTSGNVAVDKSGWDDAHAEIHFSLKTIAGRNYLLKIKDKLAELAGVPDAVTFEGRSGEYDVVIRCPASILGKELYGSGGVISYGNEEYRQNIYQSETIVYPFGCSDVNLHAMVHSSFDRNDDTLTDVVKKAIEEIRECFLGSKTAADSDFDYIELAVYRLLKDYRRIVAFPYSNDMREDFAEQFMTAVNAIVVVARQCANPSVPIRLDTFNNTFDEIVNALSESMQAAGQFDRLTFNEQPSYLQNIGSYHKILRCYYGIIKDILKLLYSIDREKNNEQPVLVPLLSFGLTPIIVSQNYDSFCEDAGEIRLAKLISIKLPYQALTNPAKYLGILVHEVFHYAAPSDRAKRNMLLTKCLAGVALAEFLSLIAKGQMLGTAGDFGSEFYRKNKLLFNMAVECWSDEIAASNPSHNTAQYDKLKSMYQKTFKLECCSASGTTDYYFGLWCNLRSQLLFNLEACEAKERKVFALDISDEQNVHAAFTKMIGEVMPADLTAFNRILNDVMQSLGELPPDLFDVGFVLHSKDPKRKVEQFLWQLHGTQRDFSSGSVLSAAQTEDDMNYAFLSQASIRIGFFVDHHLNRLGFEKGEAAFLQCLDNWGASLDKFQTVKAQYVHDYATYLEYSSPFTDPVMELCGMVEKEISALDQISECVEIMDKLTGFYEEYYMLLDEYQKDTTRQAEFSDAVFVLSRNLIEAYQKQNSIRGIFSGILQVPSTVGTPSGNGTINPAPKRATIYASVAGSSAELSRAIYAGYSAMKPAGVMPVLWYRGQRVNGRESLPNIMRGALDNLEGTNSDKKHFLHTIQEELRWARASILPVGSDFIQADWLAFLQHNEFKTNVLDFSESLYPALYFAIEKWNCKKPPKVDAVVTMFNPVLFNLAMKSIEDGNITPELEYYLRNGSQKGGENVEPPLFAKPEDLSEYECYFDWNRKLKSDYKAQYPKAALVPKNNERMKHQSGQFVFFDMQCDRQEDKNGKYSYSNWSLEQLHKKYEALFEEDQKEWFTPFMYNIIINHARYQDFKDYLQAIGMQMYQVYPEYDKLAKDIIKQLGLDN